MTVREILDVIKDEGLSDDDQLLIASQDGSVWGDFFVHLDNFGGKTVGVIELVGDGEDSLLGEEEEDYDYSYSMSDFGGDDE